MTDDLSKLPEIIREIAEVAGLDVALTIAERFGGRPMRFASRLTADNWLVEAVGWDAAEKISFHFTSGRGRLVLDVPQAQRYRLRRRIAELTDRGLGPRAIAADLGITLRSVHRNRAALRNERSKRK